MQTVALEHEHSEPGERGHARETTAFSDGVDGVGMAVWRQVGVRTRFEHAPLHDRAGERAVAPSRRAEISPAIHVWRVGRLRAHAPERAARGGRVGAPSPAWWMKLGIIDLGRTQRAVPGQSGGLDRACPCQPGGEPRSRPAASTDPELRPTSRRLKSLREGRRSSGLRFRWGVEAAGPIVPQGRVLTEYSRLSPPLPPRSPSCDPQGRSPQPAAAARRHPRAARRQPDGSSTATRRPGRAAPPRNWAQLSAGMTSRSKSSMPDTSYAASGK